MTKLENLNKYARNLTLLAKQNKLDPVINRDEEIRRIIKILSRKTKNNPVLVGEPGVGKTAIVEGMALKIVQGQVPQDLKNKQIFELDLTAIIAGASFKGEFEKRIKAVLSEVEEHQDEIIIFIDEIHLLVGTGSSGGDAMDFANILKPMMARGQIKLIGATTINEYRLYIEKDAALERRMQKVDVHEPNVEDTITILRGIKDRFETFHQVKISDGALVAASRLSDRYISDRFLPDKAIDLIDEAAANLKVELNYQPEKLEKIIQQLGYLKVEKIALEKEGKVEKLATLNKQIQSLESQQKQEEQKWISQKNQASLIAKYQSEIEEQKSKLNSLMSDGNYEAASKIKYQVLPDLESKLASFKQESNQENIVNELAIAKVVAKISKVPVDKLMETSTDKLLNLEDNLKSRVKGQDEAIALVSQAILRFKANISDQSRPIGSFLFLGPTGVGKTELARSLALNLFDNKNQIIRLDMSEFMEPHSIAKLIGAPPGYIGFEQGGMLTEKVRQNPYSIVLFDEIEKAHPDVVNILLQILDNGSLTDAKGRNINFKNTVIIMTSNLVANKILSGEQLDDEQLKSELLKFLKPEFINRIDEIIPFNKLNDNAVSQIINLELDDLNSRLEESDYKIDFDNSINTWILNHGFDQNYGARPIKRFIKKEIETWVAKQIVSKQIVPKTHFIISWEQGQIKARKI
ncbi:ATP-dependent Clp protease ATP-binding subunit [Mesomycoplasma bovoculi]|uniref:ATP-dependent chaperone ClpB n=1 Tax=Mesomycoplasma bovoculi M165/69 TaxID=743966 RepID=W5USX7_9BACT|nr:AAA family ATPase [Mesomycoplasma bovoculi]AHH45237.1 ATP-dependent chaperone ClpB [Mesomycoplasma bovoculi M165/69]